MVAPPGLEPGSGGPEPPMLDRYTTELCMTSACWKFNYLFGKFLKRVN